MKIDAIIFDIGNVLLPFDYMRSAKRLMEKNGMTEPPEREPIVATMNEYETGTIDRDEFLRRLRQAFQDTGPGDEFLAIWQDIFVANEALHDLIPVLAKKVPLYLLSNIGDIHHEFIFEHYPVFSYFRDGIFSYKAGLMKPDPRIFTLAVEQFGVNPARTVYLDDVLENVEAAQACGFLARHYTLDSHEAIERELLELLLA